MNLKKIFRQVVSALIIILVMLCNAVSHAEIKTYEGFGEYFLEEGETIDFGKNQSALIAARDAIEQVRLYIKSNSHVLNSKLLEDEIITIAVGILRVIYTKHTINAEDKLLSVKTVITATIDTDELETLLDNAIKNR